MNFGSTDKAFTQNWLQSLTQVANEPTAKRIKPLLDTINDLSRMNTESNRLESAQKLWDFATSEGLKSLLEIVPIQQPNWIFDRDDPFVYQHKSSEPITDFDSWTRSIGIVPCEVSLVAEVASADWLSLVRKEAVRLQRPLSTAGMPSGLNLELPCKAVWDLTGWSIRFDQADWVVLRYEEPFSTERPDLSDFDESLIWTIAKAHEALVPKNAPNCTNVNGAAPWIGCVKRLESLHKQILSSDAKDYAPWFRRTWACVWTVIYREQNVLRGQANVDVVRAELTACVGTVPRLTTWMFAFAKLLCENQLGRGLGICGDYTN